MKLKKKEWSPKKNGHTYTDIKLLTVYCINNGCDSPDAAAYMIHDGDWMHKESKHREYKDILKHVKQAWPGAKKEFEEGTNTIKEKKFSEPEKMEQALNYVLQNIVFDSLKNTYLTKDGKESSPSDCYINYNHLIAKERYIQKFFFETAFESAQIPQINPIKQWADDLPSWNKKDIIKQLCSYVPAKDPIQFELFLKSWLIRVYLQAVNPHNKSIAEVVNRHFLILQSDIESSGKSSFLSWLAPDMDWVKISGIEQGKDGKRALAEYMIIVDDEMSGITQFKEHEAFKSLISMPKVDVRLPYARKDSRLIRVASFCGSCNNARLFPVGEQSTRFLCVPLLDKMFDFKGYTKHIDKGQLWAQVKHLCNTTWLYDNDSKIRELRTKVNEEFERESMEHHIIQSHIREQLPSDCGSPHVNQFGDYIPIVLRTTDIINMANTIPQYKSVRFNINVLGSILRKNYGAPVNGWVAKDLIVEDVLTNQPRINEKKYESSGIRAKGYKLYFSPSMSKNEKLLSNSKGKKSRG